MLSKFARTALSLAAAIATLAPLHADPLAQYTVTAIGQFNGISLNNNGQVTANRYLGSGALVWDPVSNSTSPLTSAVEVYSINNLGAVGGRTNLPGAAGAVWDNLGALSSFGNSNTRAIRINDSGQVLVTVPGVSFTTARRTGSTSATLTLPGGGTAIGYDMNNAGAIAGDAFATFPGGQPRAAVWEASSTVATFLTTGPGTARAINDSGQVAGTTTSASGTRAVLWNRQSNGTYLEELLSELVANANSYNVRNINNSGAVIGDTGYFVGASFITKQVLWHADGSVVDITAIAEAAGISDFLLRDINDSGWLLGVGVRDGISQSFLFKPTVVPEPGFYLSLALGLGGLWFAHRRRA